MCGIIFTWKNHFTLGNLDWFAENNIPLFVQDVIFLKIVCITLCKVIFPGKKLTTIKHPCFALVNRYCQAQIQLKLSTCPPGKVSETQPIKLKLGKQFTLRTLIRISESGNFQQLNSFYQPLSFKIEENKT